MPQGTPGAWGVFILSLYPTRVDSAQGVDQNFSARAMEMLKLRRNGYRTFVENRDHEMRAAKKTRLEAGLSAREGNRTET